MIRSTSVGEICARLKATTEALAPIVEANSSSAAMRRSRMPVRVNIHSSEVSTSFVKSSFVSIFSGRYEAMVLITANDLFMPFLSNVVRDPHDTVVSLLLPNGNDLLMLWPMIFF